MDQNISLELIDFIKKTPTIFHCVSNVAEILEKNGFEKRELIDITPLKKGNNYYSVFNDSALIAYSLPENFDNVGLKVVASHGDSPCFKIKPNSEIVSDGYTRLATEKYGGMINSCWLDRPLKIAGRVYFKKDNKAVGKNVFLDGHAVIPNVAIHMNRNANSGYEYNAQRDLFPLYAGGSTPLKSRIAKACECNIEDILDYDLYLYAPDEGILWGENNEFISSPRLDDLQCVYSTLKGFLKTEKCNNIKVYCLFNNEEVGSMSVSGADSILLSETVRKIVKAFDLDLLGLCENGRLLSADNAHAVHPNHPEYADPKNAPKLNGGVVIKYNANQKYVTNAQSGAEFRIVCDNAGVKYQLYANRSDIPGGSTLGSISSTQLPLSGIDIGAPQLAMHSCFETAGTGDTYEIMNATKAFLEN